MWGTLFSSISFFFALISLICAEANDGLEQGEPSSENNLVISAFSKVELAGFPDTVSVGH